MAVSIYILSFPVFVTRRQLIVETFNEITQAMLLYHIIVFSAYQLNDETKQHLGKSFDAFIAFNLLFHVTLVAITSICKCRLKCKQGIYHCRCKRQRNKKVKPVVQT